VRALLYQSRVNLELFKFAKERLLEAMESLNSEDFARVMGGCHMTEGVFGSDRHRANQMMYKEQVIAFLLATVTAGHRFTRSIKAARANERASDWKTIKYDLTILEKQQYQEVRNFMEHLDESIASGQLEDGLDCTFSPESKLTCKEKGSVFYFDFTKDALNKPEEVYSKLLGMLQKRNEKAEQHVPKIPGTPYLIPPSSISPTTFLRPSLTHS